MEFRPVVVAHAYEQIVRQIEERVRGGGLAAGDKLPTERELGRSFGVGRGAVRDALRVLETMGLVESRQGSGTYVRREPVPVVSRALTLSVAASEHSVEHLFAYREPLEVHAAWLAARSRSEAQKAAINHASEATAGCADAGDQPAFKRADWAFHGAIAEASGNPYLAVTLEAVRDMQRDVIPLVLREKGVMSVAAAQHRRVAAAIAAGDADAAAAAMRLHVRYSADARYREGDTARP